MKANHFFKGAFLVLFATLAADSDVIKVSADEGRLCVMESGNVWYHRASQGFEEGAVVDFDLDEQAVKIGKSDLEIYEIDEVFEPLDHEVDEPISIETSHPEEIFFPIEKKGGSPKSRPFLHVDLENGLERLVLLDEKRSLVVCHELEEVKVVSTMQNFALLSNGLIYEGEGVIPVGTCIVLNEGNDFTYGNVQFSKCGYLTEERNIAFKVPFQLAVDNLEMDGAITALDRGCPFMWITLYMSKVGGVSLNRVMLSVCDDECFYLDPATWSFVACIQKFASKVGTEKKKIVSVTESEIEFDDGEKTLIIQELDEGLEGTTMDFPGAKLFFEEVKNTDDGQRVVAQVETEGESVRIAAVLRESKELKATLSIIDKEEGESMEFVLTAGQPFLDLWMPKRMEVGKTVMAHVYQLVDKSFPIDVKELAEKGVDFIFKIYGEVDE